MAHMWAQWLTNPCHLRASQCSAREQNQKWPTCGHSGYLTPAVSGVPNALHGNKIRNGPHAQWLPNPCCLRSPQCSAREQNQKWPTCGHSCYLTPAVSGVPNALRGNKIRNGPHAQWLPNPCCLRSPQCSAREQNRKWPTCGHVCYLTPAVSGVPNALHGNKMRNGPHVGTVAT